MSAAILYFCITFALTWSFWLIAAGYADRDLPAALQSHALQTLYLYLGIFSPALVAIVATALQAGMRAVGTLLASLFKWRVSWIYYAVAVGLIAAVKLIGAGAYRVEFGHWPPFGADPIPLLFAATVLSVVVGGQTGEEIGWRGYALPKLSASIGLASASLLLGVAWAAWHLPLFFIFPTADTYGQSFPVYLLQVTAYSVAIAWLWWRTNGSLLITMLAHSAYNNIKDIVPALAGARPPHGTAGVFTLHATFIGWTSVAFLWLAAAYFLASMAWQAGRFAPQAATSTGREKSSAAPTAA